MFKYINLLLLPIVILSCNAKKKVQDQGVKEAPQIVDQHNSMNSLDWNGTYTGVIPCADCDGIETVLLLKKDLSYTLQQKYQGKQELPFTENGSFSWSDNGQVIRLNNQDDQQYFVGENNLRKLDLSGKKIEGDLALNYRLTKVTTQITDSHWALVSFGATPISFDKQQGTQPYFILKPTEGKVVYGHSGCNRFSGTYRLSEGQGLHFEKLASTKMACMHMDLETRFLRLINKIDNYTISGDTLRLHKAKTAPLATFVRLYFQ